MAYTATDVKNLRERTGAGMMDCKKALDETGGDFEAAVDSLRAKGLATASKKSSRTAAEGLVGVAVSGTKGAAVEVNSETDFVARNPTFQDMVGEIAAAALKVQGNLDKLSGATYASTKATVADTLKEMIGSIGENMTLRRTAHLAADKGVVASYMHNQALELQQLEAAKKDAQRWQAVKPMFRTMSANIDGNHTWTLAYHGLLKGASMDDAADKVIQAEGKA